MNQWDKSYVISVSCGTGCYRHIRISAGMTLFNLHEAIMDAFEFIDDHAHAFFMNNRIWDVHESYYSDMIEDEERYTPDYELHEFELEVGRKFKYVFDFGDEWVFECKLLKILDETTKEPEVIREKGEPPVQYNFDDEDDEGYEDDE